MIRSMKNIGSPYLLHLPLTIKINQRGISCISTSKCDAPTHSACLVGKHQQSPRILTSMQEQVKLSIPLTPRRNICSFAYSFTHFEQALSTHSVVWIFYSFLGTVQSHKVDLQAGSEERNPGTNPISWLIDCFPFPPRSWTAQECLQEQIPAMLISFTALK